MKAYITLYVVASIALFALGYDILSTKPDTYQLLWFTFTNDAVAFAIYCAGLSLMYAAICLTFLGEWN